MSSVATDIYIRTKNHFVPRFKRRVVKRKNPSTVVVSREKFRLLAAILILAVPALGTSGIVVVTSDYVLIGADSAILHTNKGIKTRVTQQCKILKEGSIFYFVAGEYVTPHLHFDSYAIAKQAISQGRTLQNIMAAAEVQIIPVIPAILRYNQSTRPNAYADWIRGMPIISLAFATVENGKPAAIVADFVVDSNGHPMKPADRTMISAGQQVQMAEVGFHREMDTILDHPTVSFINLTWLEKVRALIQAEIDASSRARSYEVGPPISIVRISSGDSGFVPGYEGACICTLPINKGNRPDTQKYHQ
jgi:hypothetical protein